MPTATNQGIDLHYEVTGDGPPVVLLHSFLCSGAMWEGQVETLSAHARILNLDLRGHGRSGPVTKSFSPQDLVEDVLAVLDAEGVRTAVWAGLSIGGMTALRAALRARPRVKGLVLFDTDAGAERGSRKLEYRLMGLVAQTIGLRPLLGPVCRKMFGRSTRRERPELVRAWRTRFAEVHVPSTLLTLDALLARRDLRPRLAEIDVPTLVAVGSEDVSLPPARSIAIANGIPDCEYVEIPAAGHLSALEQPSVVNEAMLDFLLRLRCGSTSAVS